MNVFRFAVLLSVSTFILLLIGSIVNPTGSSLACPDWPTCFDTFFPEMKNGVEYEHTHRVAASIVGLFTFGLAFISLRSKTNTRTFKSLTVFASVIVICQGILGGITVIYRLPLFVSTGHLALAMLFFTLTIYLVFRSYAERNGIAEYERIKALVATTKPVRVWALVGGIGIYLQIVLGAFVRHTQSGRVCGTDIPMCGGEWWPALQPQQLHMLHRFVGVVLLLAVIVIGVQLRLEARRLKNVFVFRLARWLPTTVTLQILLGVLTVTSFVGLVQVTAHFAVGVAIMGLFWMAYNGLHLPPPHLMGNVDAKQNKDLDDLSK